MAQIQYSLVATSDTLLIEANVGSSSAKYVRACRKILKKISRGDLRRPDGMATLLSGSYAYNYIHGCEPEDNIPSLESLVFLCVTEALPYAATPSETREAAFTFLTSIRRAFLEQFRGDLDVLCKHNPTSDTASIDSNSLLNIDNQMKADLRRFSSYMKDQMITFAEDPSAIDEADERAKYDSKDPESKEEDFQDLRAAPPPSGHPTYHPSSGSKITRIISQIEQAKDTLRDNIDVVMGRGEELSLLNRKAADVNENSRSFQQRSRRVQYHYCRDLYQQRCVLATFAIFILYLISAMLCGWTWDSCGKS